MSPVSPVPSLIDEKKSNSISSIASPNATFGEMELKHKSTRAHNNLQAEVNSAVFIIFNRIIGTEFACVIWSYIGFSNLNYALSEVKNPQRTVRLAIAVVTVLKRLTSGSRLVAALLFRNVYGPKAECALSVFVAMSALGNVMSVTFSQGCVNQELGREGILPFWKFWDSNRPFNAPLVGLLLHWAICLIVIFALPPGDAYNFVINVISYPLSVINAAISFGILWMAIRPYPGWPLTRVWSLVCATFFGAVNVFLFIVPLTSPPEGAEPYESLPYWTHAVGGWAVSGIGAVY
ncbi:hypothetical protein CPC08DRAFT_768479 [Agrocybe pediades]|nr:hypothetical protein CPC08DRAFT_768479 [Agrocybe pediades]